jgi:hypothetical protein
MIVQPGQSVQRAECPSPNRVIFDRGSGLCCATHFRLTPKADVRSL